MISDRLKALANRRNQPGNCNHCGLELSQADKDEQKTRCEKCRAKDYKRKQVARSRAKLKAQTENVVGYEMKLSGNLKLMLTKVLNKLDKLDLRIDSIVNERRKEIAKLQRQGFRDAKIKLISDKIGGLRSMIEEAGFELPQSIEQPDDYMPYEDRKSLCSRFDRSFKA